MLAIGAESRIAEEAVHGSNSSSGRGRLEGGESSSLGEEGGVTGTGIVKQGPDDLAQ